MVTKSGVDCQMIDMAMLFEDPNTAIEAIRESQKNLVIVTAVLRLLKRWKFLVRDIHQVMLVVSVLLFQRVFVLKLLLNKSQKNLVIVTAIDRIPFDYKYICSLLYYNLLNDATYMITEIALGEITSNMRVTVTVQ